MIQTLRFEAIYESCYEQVYRFSLSYTGNPALAEEVTQEAFARLLQQKLKEIRKPVAWLIRVARNLAADALRDRPVEGTLELKHSADTPEARLVQQGLRRDIVRAVAGLSRHQRDCITLREYGGLSYAEIGQTLDLSLNEVRVHLYRARRNLQKSLKDWL